MHCIPIRQILFILRKVQSYYCKWDSVERILRRIVRSGFHKKDRGPSIWRRKEIIFGVSARFGATRHKEKQEQRPGP